MFHSSFISEEMMYTLVPTHLFVYNNQTTDMIRRGIVNVKISMFWKIFSLIPF